MNPALTTRPIFTFCELGLIYQVLCVFVDERTDAQDITQSSGINKRLRCRIQDV